MRRLSVLVGGLLLLASPVRADEVDEFLAQAERLFNELEYAKAIQIADRVLQTPDVEPEKLVEAYRIKGLSLSGDDRIDDAFMVFRRLMAIDPRYHLSKDVSPRLAAPFYQAAAIAGEEGVIELTHIEPTEVADLAGLELSVHLKANPYNMIKRIRLRYRTPANDLTGELKTDVQGKKKGPVAFRLPANIKTDALLYHFEALGEHGGVVGRAGSGAHPFRVVVTKKVAAAGPDTGKPKPTDSGKPPEKGKDPKATQAAAAATSRPKDDLRDGHDETPVWETWWFWTAIGGGVVVVTAVAVGVALGTAGPDDFTYQIRSTVP